MKRTESATRASRLGISALLVVFVHGCAQPESTIVVLEAPRIIVHTWVPPSEMAYSLKSTQGDVRIRRDGDRKFLVAGTGSLDAHGIRMDVAQTAATINGTSVNAPNQGHKNVLITRTGDVVPDGFIRADWK